MASRLPKDRTRNLMERLFTTLDVDSLGNKSVRTISSILVGINHRDAAARGWIEELFWRDSTSTGIRKAIAEALLENDRWRPGGQATKVKDDPRCPPEVATYIVNKLRI